jgi:hypothetical protein
VTLRQVTCLVPAKSGGTRQIHALTSRADLPAGEVCWRMTSRCREENYFRYARTRFALDSYAAGPDDPDRMVPNPAEKTAAGRIRAAEDAVTAAETARDAALLQLRSPAPDQAAYLSNQVINALAAPVEATFQELEEAEQAAAAVPARIRLGALAPDTVRLDAEVKLDPLTAPRRTQALAALCDQLSHAQACYPGTDLVLRYEVKSHPSPA